MESIAYLLEREPERAVSDRADVPRDELGLSLRGEHVDVPADQDLDPVPEFEPQARGHGPEHHAWDLRGRVLQGEVRDPRRRAGHVPDLPADDHVRERGMAADDGPERAHE